MSKYKLCTKGVSSLMLKRILQPFIFGILFFLIVLTMLHFFEKYNSALGISLITLGVMGTSYLFIFYWLGRKGIIFNKVAIKIRDICIVKINSVDYGDEIFYPLISYEYTVGGNKYISKNVCWDDRSCYITVWYENEDENKGLAYAEQKIDEIISNNIVYSLKLLPSVSYLDISFSLKRNFYFFTIQIVSLILIITGVLWL